MNSATLSPKSNVISPKLATTVTSNSNPHEAPAAQAPAPSIQELPVSPALGLWVRMQAELDLENYKGVVELAEALVQIPNFEASIEKLQLDVIAGWINTASDELFNKLERHMAIRGYEALLSFRPNDFPVAASRLAVAWAQGYWGKTAALEPPMPWIDHSIKWGTIAWAGRQADGLAVLASVGAILAGADKGNLHTDARFGKLIKALALEPIPAAFESFSDPEKKETVEKLRSKWSQKLSTSLKCAEKLGSSIAASLLAIGLLHSGDRLSAARLFDKHKAAMDPFAMLLIAADGLAGDDDKKKGEALTLLEDAYNQGYSAALDTIHCVLDCNTANALGMSSFLTPLLTKLVEKQGDCLPKSKHQLARWWVWGVRLSYHQYAEKLINYLRQAFHEPHLAEAPELEALKSLRVATKENIAIAAYTFGSLCWESKNLSERAQGLSHIIGAAESGATCAKDLLKTITQSLKTEAADGNADSMWLLAQFHENGYGDVPVDLKKALELSLAGAEKGSEECLAFANKILLPCIVPRKKRKTFDDLPVKYRDSKILELWALLATQDGVQTLKTKSKLYASVNPQPIAYAAYRLAECCLAKEKYEDAKKWALHAYDLGYAPAVETLHRFAFLTHAPEEITAQYAKIGLEKSQEVRICFVRRAVRFNLLESLRSRAKTFLQLLKPACSSKDPTALCVRGHLYFRLGSEHWQKAFDDFKEASKEGSLHARGWLARIYYRGLGVVQAPDMELAAAYQSKILGRDPNGLAIQGVSALKTLRPDILPFAHTKLEQSIKEGSDLGATFMAYQALKLKDFDQAESLARKALDLGCPYANVVLSAVISENTKTLTQERSEEAIQYLIEGIKLKVPEAWTWLSYAAIQFPSLLSNYPLIEAVGSFSEKGDLDAMGYINACSLLGRFDDGASTMQMLEKLAKEHNNVNAQLALAVYQFDFRARNSKVALPNAFEWAERACEHPSVEPIHFLEHLIYFGRYQTEWKVQPYALIELLKNSAACPLAVLRSLALGQELPQEVLEKLLLVLRDATVQENVLFAAVDLLSYFLRTAGILSQDQASQVRGALVALAYRKNRYALGELLELYGTSDLVSESIAKQLFSSLEQWSASEDEDPTGEIAAQLSNIYESGLKGIAERDIRKAFEYSKLADQRGSASGAFQLAGAYLNDELAEMGLPAWKADPAKAYVYYKKASEGGLPLATAALAEMVYQGLGCEADSQAAFAYAESALQTNAAFGHGINLLRLFAAYEESPTPELKKEITEAIARGVVFDDLRLHEWARAFYLLNLGGFDWTPDRSKRLCGDIARLRNAYEPVFAKGIPAAHELLLTLERLKLARPDRVTQAFHRLVDSEDPAERQYALKQLALRATTFKSLEALLQKTSKEQTASKEVTDMLNVAFIRLQEAPTLKLQENLRAFLFKHLPQDSPLQPDFQQHLLANLPSTQGGLSLFAERFQDASSKEQFYHAILNKLQAMDEPAPKTRLRTYLLENLPAGNGAVPLIQGILRDADKSLCPQEVFALLEDLALAQPLKARDHNGRLEQFCNRYMLSASERQANLRKLQRTKTLERAEYFAIMKRLQELKILTPEQIDKLSECLRTPEERLCELAEAVLVPLMSHDIAYAPKYERLLVEAQAGKFTEETYDATLSGLYIFQKISDEEFKKTFKGKYNSPDLLLKAVYESVCDRPYYASPEAQTVHQELKHILSRSKVLNRSASDHILTQLTAPQRLTADDYTELASRIRYSQGEADQNQSEVIHKLQSIRENHYHGRCQDLLKGLLENVKISAGLKLLLLEQFSFRLLTGSGCESSWSIADDFEQAAVDFRQELQVGTDHIPSAQDLQFQSIQEQMNIPAA